MKTVTELLLDTGKYELKDFFLGNVDCSSTFDEILDDIRPTHKSVHVRKFVHWLIEVFKRDILKTVDWDEVLDHLNLEGGIYDENKSYKRYVINEDFELNNDDIDKLNIMFSKFIKDYLDVHSDELVEKCMIRIDEISYNDINGEFIIDNIDSDLMSNTLFNYIKDNYDVIKFKNKDNKQLKDMSKEELIKKIKKLEG